MADGQLWFSNQGHEDLIDALVCEVHHRLVPIHPFVNGSGRASRMFADLFLFQKTDPPSLGAEQNLVGKQWFVRGTEPDCAWRIWEI